MVRITADAATIIELLVQRLGWPVKLVRWRTARSVRALLESDRWSGSATSVLLNWLETRQYESEVATALSVLLVTAPSGRPSFHEVVGRIHHPSLLSDLLLEQIYGPGQVQGGWDATQTEVPAGFVPTKYFESHKTQDVPLILRDNLLRLERKSGRPFLRQWAFEWQQIQDSVPAPYSDYPNYFGDFNLGRSGVHPQVLTRQSEVLRSAYLRTFGYAVSEWGMPLQRAIMYVTDTLPVLLGLFEVDPAPAPEWLGDFANDCCASGADLEKLARRIFAASQGEGQQLLSLTVPTPQGVVEFGEISLQSYFVSDDVAPRNEAFLPDLQEFLVPDNFSFLSDLPDTELARWYSRWRKDEAVGTVKPTTFAAIPLLHGTWHDEYIGAGLRLPTSECFVGSVKVDADRSGLKVTTGSTEVARTTFWHDHWTPLNMPERGGTRVGSTCHLDHALLTRTLKRQGLRLAWQVRVTTYTTKDNGWGDLVKGELGTFFIA